MVNCITKPDFNPSATPIYPPAMDQLPGMFHGYLTVTIPKIVIFFFPLVITLTVFLIAVSGTSQTYRLPKKPVKILIQKVRLVAQDSVFLTSAQTMLMLLC